MISRRKRTTPAFTEVGPYQEDPRASVPAWGHRTWQVNLGPMISPGRKPVNPHHDGDNTKGLTSVSRQAIMGETERRML